MLSPAPHRAPVAGLLCALLAACAGAPQAPDQPVDTWDPAETPIAVVLTMVPPEEGGYLEVEYTVSLPDEHRAERQLPQPLEVAFPSAWAGRDDFFLDIEGIRAHDLDGAPLTMDVHVDGRVMVDHDGLDDLVVSYRVRPGHRLLTESSRFYALLSANRFYAPGHAVFAQPLNLSDGAFDEISVSFRDDFEEWALGATVDVHEGPLSMEQLVNCSLFAGAYERVQREVDGHLVDLFAEPQLAVPRHGLTDRTLAVVRAQDHILGPDLAARTVVVVLRREEDPHTLTGNGREGGFVLELGNRIDEVDDELLELIAHENLHRLNGHSLTFSARDEFATLWFREGVTEYLAVRTLVAAGVVDEDRLFQHIASSITMYRGNPIAGHVAAPDLGEQFWSDRDYRRLPYDKGALLGMLVDLRLREAGIEGGLGDFLAFLREDPASRDLPLSNRALRDGLERFSGDPWQEFFDDYVLGTTWLPVFETLNTAGLEVVERLEPAPYYGFRTNLTARGEWYVSEVAPGSPADQYGLMAGMVLTDEPVVPDSAHGGTASLSVSSAGGAIQVEVPSVTGQRRAYAIVEHPRADVHYRLAFGL